METKFSGTGVALVTPFTDTQEIDYEGLSRLIDFVSDGGVDYLVVLGTTGESATLSLEEKNAVLSFVKQHNPKKLPIMYGLGGNNTRELLSTIHQTDFTGVDAILSVSPYYNKPSQAGIYAHYRAIADACPVPVMLYNVPGRTQSNVTAATTLRLAQHPNVLGIKEASGDLLQIMEISRRKPDNFLLLSGDDMVTPSMIPVGAVGVISVLANAFPALFTRMVNEGLAGNWAAAREYLFKLLPVNALMYEEGNPVGVKQALAFAGICSNQVRLPLVPASDNLAERIKRVLEEGQLLDAAVMRR
jgi:4-hydroxy-tetrahydrodipicolinate synthase